MVVQQLQEKWGDVLVAMEANVHELIVQNVDEAKEEQELGLATMDESPSVQVSMLTTIFPRSTSTPNLAPMTRSNMMVGYREFELPPRSMDGHGSRLSRAPIRIETKPLEEK